MGAGEVGEMWKHGGTRPMKCVYRACWCVVAHTARRFEATSRPAASVTSSGMHSATRLVGLNMCCCRAAAGTSPRSIRIFLHASLR